MLFDLITIIIGKHTVVNEIKIEFNFYKSISLKDRQKIEKVAKSCPVSNSLSKKLIESLNFIYN